MFRRLGLDQGVLQQRANSAQPAKQRQAQRAQRPVRHQAEQRNGDKRSHRGRQHQRTRPHRLGQLTAGQRPQRRTERNSGVQQANLSGRHLPAPGQRRIEHPHRAGHGQQTAKQRNPADKRALTEEGQPRQQRSQRMLARLRRRRQLRQTQQG